jgi:hypothetical protein
MKRSIMESTAVYAVIDQQLGSSTDGLIAAVFADPDAADSHVLRLLHSPSDAHDRVWRVSELPVRSLLDVSDDRRMLFVVYESDEEGIRPLHLYASERLAQRKVQECQSHDQIRRLTDELSGHAISPKSYWWECCPVMRQQLEQEGRIHS